MAYGNASACLYIHYIHPFSRQSVIRTVTALSEAAFQLNESLTSWCTMGCCKGDEILLTPNHPALCLQERFIRLDWWERSVSLSHLKTHHVPLTKQSPWNHRRSTPASSSGRRLGSKQNRRAGGRVYSAWGRGSESERFHEWGGTEFPPEPIDGEHTHITYMKRKHSHNTYILYMQYNAIIY